MLTRASTLIAVDVLEDLLTRARARGSVFASSTLRGSWGLSFGHDVRLSVHPVLAGELWCRVGDEVVHARVGDVVLLRGGQQFELLSAPDAEATPLAVVLARAGVPPHGRRLEMLGEEPATEFLCGAYSFSGSLCEGLVEALPAVAVIPTDDPALAAAVALVRAELAADRPGTSMVLDRLLDVLLVGCLRALWADQLRPPVWAGVPQDPAVGAALRALHTRPEHPWTVAELAREAALSRAALARRFTAEVGSPPLAYLTAWRMQLAREALLEDGGTLGAVARQVGYANEYAFAAAFKREVGEAPGRWRARQHGRPARGAAPGAATAP
jgi:AraC-like DNA-binding protein